MSPLEQLYREQHDYELRRQHEIVTSLTLPISIYILLASGAGAMLASYAPSPYTAINHLFGLSFTAWFCTFSFGIFQLFEAAAGQEYIYLPIPLELKKYYEELIAYFEAINPQTAKATADDYFNSFLANAYMECATRNQFNNDAKSAHRHKAHMALRVSLVLMALAFVPFILNAKWETWF